MLAHWDAGIIDNNLLNCGEEIMNLTDGRDNSFLVSGSGVTEFRIKSVMELETCEAFCEFTLTATKHIHYRGGHIVKPYHPRDSADVLKHTSHTCKKALLVL